MTLYHRIFSCKTNILIDKCTGASATFSGIHPYLRDGGYRRLKKDLTGVPALEGRGLMPGEQSLGAAERSSWRPGVGSCRGRCREGSMGRLALWGVLLEVRAFFGGEVLIGRRRILIRGVRAGLGRVVRIAGYRRVFFRACWSDRVRRDRSSFGVGVGRILLLVRRGVRVGVGGALSGDYWSASQFDGELEPSPAAWSEVGAGAAEKLAP